MNFTKPSEGSDHRARIAALEKAFAVLEMFGPETPELRIADVARRGGIDRKNVV